jgi:hypothetical protein
MIRIQTTSNIPGWNQWVLASCRGTALLATSPSPPPRRPPTSRASACGAPTAGKWLHAANCVGFGRMGAESPLWCTPCLSFSTEMARKGGAHSRSHREHAPSPAALEAPPVASSTSVFMERILADMNATLLTTLAEANRAAVAAVAAATRAATTLVAPTPAASHTPSHSRGSRTGGFRCVPGGLVHNHAAPYHMGRLPRGVWRRARCFSCSADRLGTCLQQPAANQWSPAAAAAERVR